jgi:hypothetical protein
MPRVKASARGQALIEFALVLPLIFLLILNLVNFGAFIYAWITVANAARTGAQYMIMSGAWVGSPFAPSLDAVKTLATNDAQWLPNTGTPLQVQVCTLNGTDPSKKVCVGAAPPPWDTQVETDPESGHYVVGWVDVAYKCKRLVSLPLTFPPSSGITIHRRAVMRMVQ